MTHPSATTEALRAQQRAEALAMRLPPLLVAAERVAATVSQGVHGRRRVGTGETFWQFRRYEPGDSVTAIDWRQSAKNSRVFIRETEWEAAQSIWLWRDASASMAWRSDKSLPSKLDRANLLLLALAVLLVRAGERCALLNSGVPPSATRSSLPRLALTLAGGAPGDGTTSEGTGNLPRAEPLPRHARVVLIGDFLSPLSDIQASVNALAGRGLQGHLLQVLDPAEEALPYDGRVEFSGLEGEGPLRIERVEAIRTVYRERLAAQREGLMALARAAGWTVAAHATDRPPQAALLALWAALSGEAA